MLAIPHKLATYVNVHVFCIVWDILFHNITDCERTAKIISVCVKDTKIANKEENVVSNAYVLFDILLLLFDMS